MFIKLSSNCNQTMTKKKIIDFVNTYIEGSELEKDYYVQWKIIHHPEWRNNYIATEVVPERAQVGTGWFDGFIR